MNKGILNNTFIAELCTYEDNDLERKYNGLYNRVVKRVIDFCLAIVLLIILLPVFFCVAVCVALETGFPVLYTPLRGGYKNNPFHILKFRTMVKNADTIGGGTTALNDRRITKVGAFLRKTKLDEIAQLGNVILGQMSFVGPRPELVKYTDAYDGVCKNILNVRPGITDYSSIILINLDEIVGTENVDEVYEKNVLEKKNMLRLKYVAEVSFKTDFMIFISTVFHVLSKAFKLVLRRGHK